MRLGIDFGTTRTVVAAVDDGRYPVATFESERGFRDHLCGLAALVDGELRFGEQALAATCGDGAAAVASIKRAISSLAPEQAVPGLPGVTALELATAYLRWVRNQLLEHSNFELEGEALEAMVAVPANASSRQRFTTIEAFRLAGFEVVGLVAEPTAAAIEYAHRQRSALSKRSPKRYVVVYDLGGGTFDTAAVSLEDRRFALLASRGIAQLGGADFDELILTMACEAAGITVNEFDPVRRVALLEACREAKESMRPNARKTMIDASVADDSLQSVVLDAAEVFGACEPLVRSTLDVIDAVFETLRERGIDPDDPRQLGALYLVGGSSAFPPVGRALRERFKRKIKLAPIPHAATAVGLAVAADPEAGVFVKEALTRHFGVWREADHGTEKVFDPILRQDAMADGDASMVVLRAYRPRHAIGHLRFLECSELGPDGQPTGDLTPWNEVRFPYDAALREQPSLDDVPVDQLHGGRGDEIVETYIHRPDGTITVEIENQTHGYKRAYRLGSMR